MASCVEKVLIQRRFSLKIPKNRQQITRDNILNTSQPRLICQGRRRACVALGATKHKKVLQMRSENKKRFHETRGKSREKLLMDCRRKLGCALVVVCSTEKFFIKTFFVSFSSSVTFQPEDERETRTRLEV
jgi:hypothetical protein